MSKVSRKISRKTKQPSEDLTQELSRKLYENSTPIGLKSSASMPRVKFQKDITAKKASNFQIFNRYLKYKFGDLLEKEEIPTLPIKRPEQGFLQRNLYDLFQLEPGCDSAEIKKNFRKLATTHHPDKGGDPLHFRCLKQAYQILCNDEIREIYDNNGFKGIKVISDIDTTELENYIITYTSF